MTLHDQCIAAIRHRLDVLGMTQSELARSMGVTKHHVSRVLLGYERGSLPFMEGCLTVLGVDPVLSLADPSDPYKDALVVPR